VLEIVSRLAEADEFTGSPNCSATGTITPPRAEPSSLASTMPVHSAASLNPLACESAVLPGGGVDHEERLMRRGGDLLGDDTANLHQLLHQVGLGLQAARGVDDADVEAAGDRLGDRPMSDAGRVAPRIAADDLRTDPPGPHGELLHRRRRRNVSPAPSTTRLPSRAKRAASLAIDVVLPEPFTPVDEDHRRPRAARFSWADFASQPRRASCPRIESTTTRGSTSTGPEPIADIDDDGFGGGRPHVGADQGCPQLFKKGVVDQPPLPLEEVTDVGLQHLRGLRQAGP